MGRQRTGGVFFSKGTAFGRFWIAGKREAMALRGCSTEDEAKARVAAMLVMQDDLERAGHALSVRLVLDEAAKARTERGLRLVRRLVDKMTAGTFEPKGKYDGLLTFQQFAERWTSGELRKHFPDHVPEKKSAKSDVYRLGKHVYPVIGALPVQAVTLEHAEEVMRRCALSEPSSRRHVAQLLHRVMQLATYPARMIAANPIPAGFLPKSKTQKARSYLYPKEDAALLGARAVPLAYRMLYGFLSREGTRKGEAELLDWPALDLETGSVRLDINKTDDPRAWALRPDVAHALAIWSGRPGAKKSARVFAGIDWDHLAACFREHLQAAGVGRGELYERSESRKRIVAHDLRATFVTLSLASGKTESWVQDRTGHTSSEQINRYRRAARTVAELGLGELGDMSALIPELADAVAAGSLNASHLRRVK